MKLRVTTTSRSYPLMDPRKSDLEMIGFTFRRFEIGGGCYPDRWQREEKYVDVEFASLEDLLAFAERFGDLVIVDGTIEIYDSHRE